MAEQVNAPTIQSSDLETIIDKFARLWNTYNLTSKMSTQSPNSSLAQQQTS